MKRAIDIKGGATWPVRPDHHIRLCRGSAAKANTFLSKTIERWRMNQRLIHYGRYRGIRIVSVTSDRTRQVPGKAAKAFPPPERAHQ